MFNIISVSARPTLEEALESNWCYAPEGSDFYRYTSVSKLPPVFQIQINRRQYSLATGAWKDDMDVQIPETLHLGQFMDDADSSIRQQWRQIARTILAIDRDLGDKRDSLKAGPEKSQTGLKGLELLKSASEALKQLLGAFDAEDPKRAQIFEAIELLEVQVKNDLKELADIDEEKKQLHQKLRDLREKIPKTVPYRLHSVFVHRGTANSGHYFVFIYDFKRGIWRKYNDKTVEQADPKSAAIFHNYLDPTFKSVDTPFS